MAKQADDTKPRIVFNISVPGGWRTYRQMVEMAK
jgi:hypothetical protein